MKQSSTIPSGQGDKINAVANTHSTLDLQSLQSVIVDNRPEAIAQRKIQSFVLQQKSQSKKVVQRLNATDLKNAGAIWFSNVWVGGQNDNYANRDEIIKNMNGLINATGYTIGRGWKPYDPVVRPARKYTSIAADLEGNAAVNAALFRGFLENAVQLEALPAALKELALITCFAEVGRGYSSSLDTLSEWMTRIESGESQWADVKVEFDPALTYAEDARAEWTA